MDAAKHREQAVPHAAAGIGLKYDRRGRQQACYQQDAQYYQTSGQVEQYQQPDQAYQQQPQPYNNNIQTTESVQVQPDNNIYQQPEPSVEDQNQMNQYIISENPAPVDNPLITCPICGFQIANGTLFCPNCNAQIQN